MTTHRFEVGSKLRLVDPHPGQEGEWTVLGLEEMAGPHHVGPGGARHEDDECYLLVGPRGRLRAGVRDVEPIGDP